MKTRHAAILLACAMLTACGGSGGSGSAGGGVTVVSGPTPAPTPTPTPAPTPAPAPTPTYDPATMIPLRTSYGTACNGYANGQNAYAVGAGIKLSRVFREPLTPGLFHYSIVDIVVDNYSAGLRFEFDAATRVARGMAFGVAEPVYAFSAADIIDLKPARIAYAKGTKTLLLSCSRAGFVSFQDFAADLENPAIDVASTSLSTRMTGAATTTQSVLASATYSSTMTAHAFRTDVRVAERRTEAFGSLEPANLVYDASSKRITGTIRLGGTEPTTLTIDMVGSNSTRFSGTVTSSDGAKGEIIGGFYGPNAEEIGFVTSYEKFGIHYVASGSGTR